MSRDPSHRPAPTAESSYLQDIIQTNTAMIEHYTGVKSELGDEKLPSGRSLHKELQVQSEKIKSMASEANANQLPLLAHLSQLYKDIAFAASIGDRSQTEHAIQAVRGVEAQLAEAYAPTTESRAPKASPELISPSTPTVEEAPSTPAPPTRAEELRVDHSENRLQTGGVWVADVNGVPQVAAQLGTPLIQTIQIGKPVSAPGNVRHTGVHEQGAEHGKTDLPMAVDTQPVHSKHSVQVGMKHGEDSRRGLPMEVDGQHSEDDRRGLPMAVDGEDNRRGLPMAVDGELAHSAHTGRAGRSNASDAKKHIERSVDKATRSPEYISTPRTSINPDHSSKKSGGRTRS